MNKESGWQTWQLIGYFISSRSLQSMKNNFCNTGKQKLLTSLRIARLACWRAEGSANHTRARVCRRLFARSFALTHSVGFFATRLFRAALIICCRFLPFMSVFLQCAGYFITSPCGDFDSFPVDLTDSCRGPKPAHCSRVISWCLMLLVGYPVRVFPFGVVVHSA